jgi:hypothetical protein
MKEEFTVQPANFDSVKRGFVKLPFDEDQLKEFVVGLLGKPQTLSKSFKGPFEIDEDFVEHLYGLVDQRIKQQNNANLIQFVVTIGFSDQCKVELTSFDLFKTFNELKPVVAESLIITWDYLVQFQDKQVPEKQQIQLSFLAKHGPFSGMEDEFVFVGYSGSIDLRIKHTARTWATDIESLLSNQIATVLLPKSKTMSFIRRHENKLTFIYSAIFVLSSLLASYFATISSKNKEVALVQSSLLKTTDIQERVAFLLNYMAQGFWAQHFFLVTSFVVSSFVLSIGFVVWFTESILRNEPSFILLTKESEKNKVNANSKKRTKWFSMISSVAASILTGVIGNIIFVRYFQ